MMSGYYGTGWLFFVPLYTFGFLEQYYLVVYIMFYFRLLIIRGLVPLVPLVPEVFLYYSQKNRGRGRVFV